MAGHFRLGQISCCKPNPNGGWGCYTADGSLVWNSQSSQNPSPNTCPDSFGPGAPAPAPTPGPIGTQPVGPPTTPQCPPDQFWDGTQCRGSVGTIPGGTGLPNIPPSGAGAQPPAGNQGTQPPAGNQSAFAVANCNVPPGYGPAPGGGAQSPDNVVWACPGPNGTFNVINARSMQPVQSGISRECLDQYGDVTFQPGDSAICGGQPQTGPATGPCGLPKDELMILCPPSNGITADYYLYAKSAGYAPSMTTQPQSCAQEPNVIRVSAASPYCGGSEVSGPGDALPTLVGCLVQPGNTWEEGIVTLYDEPAHTMIEQKIMLKDISAKYPGRRWILTTGLFCSALPDFSKYGAPTPAPTPAPVPAPSPVTIPTTQTPATQPLITTPGAAPLTYPITNMWFPESLEPPPIQPVGGPLPIIQTYAPPPPLPAPRPYVPGQPLPVTDWFGICLQRKRGM